MESTSHNLKEAKITNDEALAKAKVSRRISLKVCVAKAKFYGVHVILKTITRTRTLKGGGFGLTPHLKGVHFVWAGEIYKVTFCSNGMFV